MQKIITPLFPTYTQVRILMEAATGIVPKSVRDMITAIHNQTGTPQNPVDWSDPDRWIAERLAASHAELALKIWKEGKGTLNPRHSYGCWMFINNFELMGKDSKGLWIPTEKGRLFLEADPETLKLIDEAEGMLDLLEMLLSHESVKRGSLLPEWTEFSRQHSTFVSQSSCTSTLRFRLGNLIERSLVSREGNAYRISEAGIRWLNDSEHSAEVDAQRELVNAIKRYKIEQKALFREKLAVMDPYQFERLIGDLLQAMGYEDVEVTKASGDKGVDVVGSVQVGITTITEVVQVKRMKGSVTRPAIDQLRGALPYHKAIRGTFITLGKFSVSCAEAALFPGAAPITLIDGDRLIDLLIEHNVGISRTKTIELWDIELEKFTDQNL